MKAIKIFLLLGLLCVQYEMFGQAPPQDIAVRGQLVSSDKTDFPERQKTLYTFTCRPVTQDWCVQIHIPNAPPWLPGGTVDYLDDDVLSGLTVTITDVGGNVVSGTITSNTHTTASNGDLIHQFEFPLP